MNRREFLVRVGGTLIAVPVVLQAIGCGDDDSTGPNPSNPHFDSTSNTVSGHTHNVSIFCSQLTGGATVAYDSSLAGSGPHQHHFSLTAAELTTINNGGTVPKTSSVDSGHSHDWLITKTGGPC